MTSAIDPTNINGNYPVAGQNNDSQGFRDNFTNIKNALTVAGSEISELQMTTVKLHVVNEFVTGSVLKNARMQGVRTAISSDPNNTGILDFSQASYFTTTPAGNITYRVTGWPTADDAGYSTVRLEVTPTSNLTVSFGTLNYGTLLADVATPVPQNVSENTKYVWDLWSVNGGTTVFVKLIGVFPLSPINQMPIES